MNRRKQWHIQNVGPQNLRKVCEEAIMRFEGTL